MPGGWEAALHVRQGCLTLRGLPRGGGLASWTKMNAPVTLHTSKFLALIQEGHWEYVDRVNATGAALIIAVTAEEKVLLVEQYRIPVHVRTIELPAGIIGDEPGKKGIQIAADIGVGILLDQKRGRGVQEMQGQQPVAKLAGEDVLANVPGDIHQAATTGGDGELVKGLAHGLDN